MKKKAQGKVIKVKSFREVVKNKLVEIDRCIFCGNRFPLPSLHFTWDMHLGERACESCLEQRYTKCSTCNEYAAEVVVSDDGQKVCRSCVESAKDIPLFGEGPAFRMPRMSSLHKEMVKRAEETVEKAFLGFNKKYCSDCRSANEGSCITVRRVGDKVAGWQRTQFYTKEAGCCSKCARQIGYFREGNLDQLRPLMKEYGFHWKYGFFDNNNKHCVLPRKLRSRACLYFCCNYKIAKKLSGIREEEVREQVEILSLIKEKYGLPI